MVAMSWDARKKKILTRNALAASHIGREHAQGWSRPIPRTCDLRNAINTAQSRSRRRPGGRRSARTSKAESKAEDYADELGECRNVERM